MIQSFGDKRTEDFYHGRQTARLRSLPNKIRAVAGRRLDQLNTAKDLQTIGLFPGNRLELLKEKLKGKYSVRINDQWRIVFYWTEKGPMKVEITDYH